MQKIIEQFRPIIVQLATPFNMGGTGFYLQDIKMIITNEHLVRDSKEVIIEADAIPRQLATVVYWDAIYDIALLQLKTDYKDLPRQYFCLEEEPQQGDNVLAMGHPLGLRFSSTIGTISNNRRPQDDFYYYQHDATLNPGNSGGPLIDKKGRIVGVNAFDMEEGTSLGFSLPAIFANETIQAYLAKNRAEVAARCLSCRKMVFEGERSSRYCPNCGTYLLLPCDAQVYEPVGTLFTIEQLLESLGQEVKLARRGVNTWEIKEGSAHITVSYHEDTGLVTADAHLCQLPSENAKDLYEYLLEQNYVDDGLTFSVKGRDIILSILIYDRYLDIEPATKRFQHLFEQADYYDNLLVERFNARWKYAEE